MTAAAAPPAPAEDRARIGDWGITFTGRQFWLQDPRIGDIDIADIAHALSNQCRWAGHTREFYSVAQHSVLVSQLCSPANKVVGLLHDSPEAYLQDLIKPLKKLLSGYRALENAWAICIGLTYGLDDKLLDLPREVHRADRMVCIAERRDLVAGTASKYSADEPRLEERIEPWSADRAEREFLWHWRLYGGGR